ncbi:hypothetical protein DTO282E5_5026 [Paecilomyces variotii]|nr:hypothetical protein DTO282E5_5026 [Paecilomyces variotii]
MRYDISSREQSIIAQRLRDLPSPPIDLAQDELRKPGSSWTKKHMDALRVASIDDLLLSRFFSSSFLPKDDDRTFHSLANQVTHLSEDDIRSLSGDKLRSASPPFQFFFQHLGRAVSTKSAAIPGAVDYESSDDDLSSSGEEDQGESSSRSCLIALLSGILQHQSLAKVAPGWELAATKTMHATSGWGPAIESKLGMTALKRMFPDIVKAKRRHAGGQVRRAGDAERFNWDTLAQEVAELLGQAMTSCKKMHGGWKDQDAWIISIHGTQLRLVTARFKEGYLRQVNSSMVAQTEYVVVFRSRPFDLKLDEGRVQAVKAIIALLRWIKSGNSLQSTIRGVLNAAKSGA